jgi:soluble lytic murein transglycosylase-like protein
MIAALALTACLQFAPHVEAAALAHDVPTQTLYAVMWTESHCEPDALNRTSGATGLMQVIPRWGRRTRRELLDVATNIDTGARMLAWFRRYCKDDKRGIGAYYAGVRGCRVNAYARRVLRVAERF